MVARRKPRTVRVLPFCFALLGAFAMAGSLARGALLNDTVPAADRKAIEALLRGRTAALLNEKDANGASFKRGNWSRSFKKVDASTYLASMHVDTAGADRLTTERQLLTVKKDATGKWAVATTETQDTYSGLLRGTLGDEKFYSFDKLAFDREGLKLTSGPGFVLKDFLHGEPIRMVIYADGMTYEYAPPKTLDYYQVHTQVMMKKFSEDFAFRPERAIIECSPQSCKDVEAAIFVGLKETTEAAISPKLKEFYAEGQKEYKDLLAQNAFAGFRTAPEPDRRVYTTHVRRAGQKAYTVSLDVDNYESPEVHFYSSSYGPVFQYHQKEVRESAADPTALERRDSIDQRDYELYSLKGTVELAVEDAETISGDLTYGMTLKRPLRELPFSISRVRIGDDNREAKNPRMFVHSITDDAGNELTWMKLGASRGVIVLPQESTVGQKLTLRMQFESQDSIYKVNPSYSELDRGGWLPLVRFGDMIPEFELTVRVPERYTTLGVGKKLSETSANGVRITKWKADAAVTFPTVIFGNYLHDTPDIKATKADGTPIQVDVWVDKTSASTAGVGGALLPGQDGSTGADRGIRGSQLKSIGDQAANALNLFREIYGVDYPYSKLDLVNAPFQPGAQAPSSIIYLGDFLFRGEGLLASMTGGNSAGIAKFLKDTVAHETAHQWWGSLICMANFRNYWFVESLAEYSSALYVEALYGRKKYLEKVGEWREELLRAAPVGSVQDSPAVWAGDFDSGSTYIANVYNKGPYAFHTLRETFGDDKFFAFLKSLAKDLAGKEIVTRDIQSVAETSFGGNMDWFFDQWIRGVGLPQFAINYSVRKTEDGKFLVEGKIKQRVTVGPDKTELPGVMYRGVGRITFIFHNGKEFTYPKPLLVEKAETSFALKIPEEPAEVHFNKYGEILAHDVLVNKSW